MRTNVGWNAAVAGTGDWWVVARRLFGVVSGVGVGWSSMRCGGGAARRG